MPVFRDRFAFRGISLFLSSYPHIVFPPLHPCPCFLGQLITLILFCSTFKRTTTAPNVISGNALPCLWLVSLLQNLAYNPDEIQSHIRLHCLRIHSTYSTKWRHLSQHIHNSEPFSMKLVQGSTGIECNIVDIPSDFHYRLHPIIQITHVGILLTKPRIRLQTLTPLKFVLPVVAGWEPIYMATYTVTTATHSIDDALGQHPWKKGRIWLPSCCLASIHCFATPPSALACRPK